MRTDSVNLSDKFLNDSRGFVKDNFGVEFCPDSPRRFKTKSRGAQEAHEAIRPTEVFQTPDEVKDFLTPQQYKLYNLIWRRAVASQMKEAVINNTTIDVNNDKNDYLFRATGQVIKFPGFLKVYPASSQEVILPELVKNEKVELLKIEPCQHFTQPPARFSDATLVKTLEEKGIGRPSTYAPTIATIIERGYVQREEKKLKPTEIAFLVSDLLVEHFPDVVDYDFTAQMEAGLDDVAEGKIEWQPLVSKFYMPFSKNLEDKYQEVNKEDLINEETQEVCDKCGKPMVIKTGRFGRFLACTGFPECKNTKQLNGQNGAAVEEEKLDEKCPNCGSPMVYKTGRFGRFIACSNYPKCKTTKQILKPVGIKCPECQAGEVVMRRAKGRTFFGCSRYPECKFISWKKPE
jgi:DNA topoisomerase-1